jgi:hypothetical protein
MLYHEQGTKVKPLAPKWPEFDIELDCYWMTGTSGSPVIYGDSSGECLQRYQEALRLESKHKPTEVAQ